MDTIEALKPIFYNDGGIAPLTWNDLKGFISTLSDEQLKQPLCYIGEEMGGTIHAIGECQDDMIDPSGDGVVPVSFLKEEEPGEDWDEETIIWQKGRLFFDMLAVSNYIDNEEKEAE